MTLELSSKTAYNGYQKARPGRCFSSLPRVRRSRLRARNPAVDVIAPPVRLGPWPPLTLDDWQRIPDSPSVWFNARAHLAFQVMDSNEARLVHVCGSNPPPDWETVSHYGCAAILVAGLARGALDLFLVDISGDRGPLNYDTARDELAKDGLSLERDGSGFRVKLPVEPEGQGDLFPELLQITGDLKTVYGTALAFAFGEDSGPPDDDAPLMVLPPSKSSTVAADLDSEIPF